MASFLSVNFLATPLAEIDVGGAKIDGALVQKKLGVHENRRGKIRKVDKIGLR